MYVDVINDTYICMILKILLMLLKVCSFRIISELFAKKKVKKKCLKFLKLLLNNFNTCIIIFEMLII